MTAPLPPDATNTALAASAKSGTARLDIPDSRSSDVMAGARRSVLFANAAVVLLLVSLLGWSGFSVVDEATRGEGRIVPARKIQLVQNLEGGIVRDIATGEGAMVEEGELLLRIDATGFGSDLAEQRERIAGLAVRRERLFAELNDTSLSFPDHLRTSHPTLVAQELALHQSRRLEHDASIAALNSQAEQKRQEIEETRARVHGVTRTLAIAREEHTWTAPLVKTGAAARVDVLRLEGRIAELEAELKAAELAIPRLAQAVLEIESLILKEQNAFSSTALEALNETEVDLARLRKAALAEVDKVARTEIRAPVRGIIKTLHVTTEGQVVRPGADIVEIVPLDDTLLVEARIRPNDVAFLRPGLEATVKITAYDYTVFGSLKGKLERISADAITTDKGESYYEILVRTDVAWLEKDGKKLPIIPGMVAQVDLLTGQKTILQYLIKPITRMRHEALRER